MKKIDSGFRLSATDLANHLACRHRRIGIECCSRKVPAPDWENPSLVVLQQRGIEHEKAYLRQLKSKGLCIEDLSDIEILQRLGRRRLS